MRPAGGRAVARGGSGRTRDPVPRREAARGDGRGGATACRRAHRWTAPRRRGRLSPSRPRVAPGAARAPRGAARPDGRWSLAGLHALAGLVAPRSTAAAARSSSRRPTCTTLAATSSARPRSRARCPSASEPPVPADADVADATAAILRYETGAVGTFVNSRRSDTRSIGLELVGDGLRAVVGKAGDEPGDWAITIADGRSTRTLAPGRDPYEIQAERFLDAVEAGDPDRRPLELRGRGPDRRADPGRGRGHRRTRLTPRMRATS